MRMADGAGERIGGIGGGVAGQREQALHHVLDLLLGGVAIADHRLLHLQGGVLGHRQPGEHRGANRRAARLAERQGRLGIRVHEDLLHRHLHRSVRGDHFLQAFEDRLQACGKVAGAGLDAAARDIDEALAVVFDDAETRELQARVDAEDSQSTTAVV
jgi:hypothetical protein